MQLMRVHRSEPGPPGLARRAPPRPGRSRPVRVCGRPLVRSGPGGAMARTSFGFSRSMIPSAQSAHPNATRAPVGWWIVTVPGLVVERCASVRAAFRPIVFTARWAGHSKGASSDERIRPLNRLGRNRLIAEPQKPRPPRPSK
jgi:hypothetical protein